MSSLYELTNDFERVINMLYDPEVDEQTIFDTLESIEYEIELKAENYAKMIKNLEADVAGLKAEEQRISDRRKSIENKIKWLKANLENSMKTTGRTKFRTALFSFSIQKNPPSLVIEDETVIPKEYFIPQPDIIDKSKLKEALKSGQVIPGAILVQEESLRIR
ncbi:hypothetical protein GND95_08780 [Defluviitalea raffinosedens]|uniref:Siphovirus Gp157 family protein n=1 Tax=Defluviitalea raffinosedens TaxID=1450156 RepID=A0A7C8HE96_9FIRM|nr:siphovirus Gp157 family protein [Defluviitalea raffinosedens]KAE9633738.1 hypothetical protein GND95_08780 [Defluviitalea raffinosedens]